MKVYLLNRAWKHFGQNKQKIIISHFSYCQYVFNSNLLHARQIVSWFMIGLTNCKYYNFIWQLGLHIKPEQKRAFEYYKKNCMAVEVVKDDVLQKVNFRVKNKARFLIDVYYYICTTFWWHNNITYLIYKHTLHLCLNDISVVSL